jgi:hypothetical protein
MGRVMRYSDKELRQLFPHRYPNEIEVVYVTVYVHDDERASEPGKVRKPRLRTEAKHRLEARGAEVTPVSIANEVRRMTNTSSADR